MGCASCVITSISVIFLLATLSCEILSFLTTHMIDNNYDNSIHEGIFRRCGTFYLNSAYGSCAWLNLMTNDHNGIFNSDESWFIFILARV